MRLIDLFSREEFTHLLLLSSFHHSCRCSTMGKTKKQQSVVAKQKNEYLEQNQFPTLEVF